MSEIKSRADLFEAAAKMMRMCDEAGIEYWYKIGGMLVHSTNGKAWGFDAFPCDPQSYEFPLAIVEGKPVFEGDWLYSPEGKKFQATEIETMFHVSSWNPPKPKTVMVEMSVEDAERISDNAAIYVNWAGIVEACRKALEELK